MAKNKFRYETASQRLERQLAADVKKIDIINIIQPWPTIEQLEKDGIVKQLPWHDSQAVFDQLKVRGYFDKPQTAA